MKAGYQGAVPYEGILPGQDGVLLQFSTGGGRPHWLRFASPVEVVQANVLSEVMPALGRVEAAVSGGLYAAGFLSYEAAPAFDEALVTRPPGALPLLWFGIYTQPERLEALPGAESSLPALDWQASVSPGEYEEAIARIKEYIARGDTYQVNYTMRLRADFGGDPWLLFLHLVGAQPTRYAAYVDIGEHVLCSASPELFFEREGEAITGKPMKGTAPRGRTTSEDARLAGELAVSEKNRAENVMIVDMIRNDLGRIAQVGSVQVPSLFTVERYQTLFQMTSTVTARTTASLSQTLAALFPCASITGAPKVRTAQIIAELETAPRGIYTGSIGCLTPGGQTQFNVAIRTVHVDRGAGRAEYGTGGGIVWDSTATDEYEECRTKARVLFSRKDPFRLLETLRWDPEGGYVLLERHLARLADSATYFDFPLAVDAVRERLMAAAQGFGGQGQRVRLLVAADGETTIEAAPFTAALPHPTWRVALAKRPVDVQDRFLYHKTTHRQVYEAARADFPEHDDVLLWNARGEVTESTIANVVVRLRGEWITPPVTCGLLPGTLRAELLDAGRVREGVVTLEELRAAEEVFLINSVRGWIPAVLAL